MAKHRKDAPVVGNGKSYGNGPKPTKAQCTQKTGTGTVLWKATAALFGVGGGKKK